MSGGLKVNNLNPRITVVVVIDTSPTQSARSTQDSQNRSRVEGIAGGTRLCLQESSEPLLAVLPTASLLPPVASPSCAPFIRRVAWTRRAYRKPEQAAYSGSRSPCPSSRPTSTRTQGRPPPRPPWLRSWLRAPLRVRQA